LENISAFSLYLYIINQYDINKRGDKKNVEKKGENNQPNTRTNNRGARGVIDNFPTREPIAYLNKATNGSVYNTFRAGAKPHGQKDKVLLPKTLISALPTSNQEPTLSARIGSGASPPSPLC
jgi:hypothetical protein